MNCGRSSSEERTPKLVVALSTSQEIVVYCPAVYCAASIRLYSLLQRNGYTRVAETQAASAKWEAAGHPIQSDRGR
jgi:hypothetical protein